MTSKNKKSLKFLRRNWAYLCMFVGIAALAFFGSQNKGVSNSGSTSMQSIANNNYSVSADQVSQFYIAAEIADSLKLTSSNEILNNYVTVSFLQQDGQVADTSGRISKPITVDISHLSRGVVSYVVQNGDTMESIAAKYGVSTDQIRWSNNLKTTTVSVGQSLLVPTVPGIAYSVKDGDSVESIASKYGSSVEQIIAYNDLETGNGLHTGQTILLPSGALPETERPEYVAPVYTAPSYYSYSSSSIGSSGERLDLQVVERWSYARSMMGDGNPMTPGQCTWYAWYYRAHFTDSPLPRFFGNANSWASTLGRMGYAVDHNPSVGAVFQTATGYYGHVGVVTGINGDGSITVREMNWSWQAYTVTQSRIPANLVSAYYYIH